MEPVGRQSQDAFACVHRLIQDGLTLSRFTTGMHTCPPLQLMVCDGVKPCFIRFSSAWQAVATEATGNAEVTRRRMARWGRSPRHLEGIALGWNGVS